MTPRRWLGAGLACVLAASMARAHGLAGLDAPEVRWRQRSAECPAAALSELRGRPVLLYFFRCHDAACVEQTTRINEAVKRFGPEGLAVVGLSDDPIGEVNAFLARNQCLFPGAVDEGFRALTAFGALAPPTAVLIGPEGRVAWGGVPKALLDGVIEPLCKRAVPQIPTEWPPQLAAMAARLGARDLGGALKALEKASEDIANDTRERATTAIAEHIDGWIALAKAEIESGHADTAMALLADLAARTKGTEAGTTAKSLLDEWKADAAFKLELKGCKQCAQAVMLELKWQYAAAQVVWRKVAKSYPETKVGVRAAAAADYIEQYGLATLRANCDDCRERRTPCEAHGG